MTKWSASSASPAPMPNVQLKSAASTQDVSPGSGDLRCNRKADMQHAPIGEFFHELRQPLDVIQTLAYYLEMTSSDELVRAHLQKIQAMVLRANQLLQSSELNSWFPPSASHH